MDRVAEVARVLLMHWRNVCLSKIEKLAQVEYYNEIPGYGPAFVDKLKKKIKEESRKK